MAKPPASTVDNVVSLAKRRGFVFPCGEIYGGTMRTHPEHAAHVRWIFAWFLEIGPGTELAREVGKRGIRTTWIASSKR